MISKLVWLAVIVVAALWLAGPKAPPPDAEANLADADVPPILVPTPSDGRRATPVPADVTAANIAMAEAAGGNVAYPRRPAAESGAAIDAIQPSEGNASADSPGAPLATPDRRIASVPSPAPGLPFPRRQDPVELLQGTAFR